MDSKRLKVKITVSRQLQRAINDTRRWIRVLSSETISHLKKRKKCCFINTNARLALFCDARLWLHAIRNYVEKVSLRDLCRRSSVLHLHNFFLCVFRFKKVGQGEKLHLIFSSKFKIIRHRCFTFSCKRRLTLYLHVQLVNTDSVLPLTWSVTFSTYYVKCTS